MKMAKSGVNYYFAHICGLILVSFSVPAFCWNSAYTKSACSIIIFLTKRVLFGTVFQYSDKFGENVESSLFVLANVIFELKIISSHF